jgi:hypothetical protein
MKQSKEAVMTNMLFSNVRIPDGSGSCPYSGEILGKRNPIKHAVLALRPQGIMGRSA